jgi:5-methyltetrahydrofolate--homocysteine methyltransferase
MRPYEPIRERLRGGRTVILDGAIGTEILRRNVTWSDHQLLAQPEVIRGIHEDYVRAGADVITTNTFQLSDRAFLHHFKDADHMRRVGAPCLEELPAAHIAAGVRLAREARDRAAGGRPVAVAGAITTLEWCFRPDLAPDPDMAFREYRSIVEQMADAGADLILFETINNVREAVAQMKAARAVGVPAWVAFVVDDKGVLFSGETLEQAVEALAPLEPDAILINCAPPPDVETGLRRLLPACSLPTGAYPHVGRFDPPEWMFTDEYPPASYARLCREWAGRGVRVLGGCCGTTPDHIAAVRDALAS